MGSYKIRRLHIPQNYIEVLEKNHLFSCKDVLTLTKLELQTLLCINQSTAEKLLDTISSKCVSKPKTAFEMYLKNKSGAGCLSLFPFSLDYMFDEGLPFGCITEIAGPPGVGKTQFCFMLSILSALPSSAGGLDSPVIYIDTESTFCAERIKTMAQHKFPRLYKDDQSLVKLLLSIIVFKASCIDSLKEIIQNLEREVIRNKVRVIIIDSIASLVRKEFGSEQVESVIQRNNILLEQAAVLKDLAQAYNIVIFLTNQMTSHIAELDSVTTDVVEDDEDFSNTYAAAPPPVSSGKSGNADHVIPALGNTWYHCVNTRLVAQFLNSSERQLIIAKSSLYSTYLCPFIIDETGIVLTGKMERIDFWDPLYDTLQTKYGFLSNRLISKGVCNPFNFVITQ